MKNSIARLIIQFFFDCLSLIIQIDQAITRKRIFSRWNQIPVPQHGPEDFDAQRNRLEKYFATLSGKKWWVLTSGTSKEPKKIPYDEKRIKDLNKVFLKSMIVLTSEFKGPKTFFAFGSLEKDQSLTSSMVDEYDRPSLMELLQAPYRYLATEEGKKLRLLAGDLGARVAILVVTKPRFVYATNPSTITHFLDEVQKNWSEIQIHLQNLVKDESVLKSLLRLEDGDGKKNLDVILNKGPEKLFPELVAVITWDGGYVKTFLDRLMTMLPAKTRHLPMYSMSTETIETLPHRVRGKIVFMPTMKHTLPEFMDKNGKLLRANELEANSTYTLIITNHFGLERYDTQDEFLVTEMIDRLPALKFLRRRNVTASLTGEKITEPQALLLQQMLREKYPELLKSSLSLFPVIDNKEARYHMVIIGEELNNQNTISLDAEKFLGEINSEYKDKVKSGRLLPIHLKKMSVRELASLMGQENRWESQFKVMPLYEKPVTKNS